MTMAGRWQRRFSLQAAHGQIDRQYGEMTQSGSHARCSSIDPVPQRQWALCAVCGSDFRQGCGGEHDDRNQADHRHEQKRQPPLNQALGRGFVGRLLLIIKSKRMTKQSFHFGVAACRPLLQVAAAASTASSLSALQQRTVIAACHTASRQQSSIKGLDLAQHDNSRLPPSSRFAQQKSP